MHTIHDTVFVCILEATGDTVYSNRMDSSAIWGEIARAIIIIIGTEISRAAASAIWPIASVILPQLHENPCEYYNIIPYCPAVTPPPFATYFQEKEGGA